MTRRQKDQRAILTPETSAKIWVFVKICLTLSNVKFYLEIFAGTEPGESENMRFKDPLIRTAMIFYHSCGRLMWAHKHEKTKAYSWWHEYRRWYNLGEVGCKVGWEFRDVTFLTTVWRRKGWVEESSDTGTIVGWLEYKEIMRQIWCRVALQREFLKETCSYQ
jgi:hypothetical protein